MAPGTPTKCGAVIGLHQAGFTAPQLAKRLSWPRATVIYTFRRWQDHGTAYDLPRLGKPPLLSARAQQSLISEILQCPLLPFSHHAHHYGVSESTIRCVANKHGFHRRLMR